MEGPAVGVEAVVVVDEATVVAETPGPEAVVVAVPEVVSLRPQGTVVVAEAVVVDSAAVTVVDTEAELPVAVVPAVGGRLERAYFREPDGRVRSLCSLRRSLNRLSTILDSATRLKKTRLDPGRTKTQNQKSLGSSFLPTRLVARSNATLSSTH